MEANREQKKKSITPMALGIIGGALGILAAFATMIVGGGYLILGKAGPIVVVGTVAVFLGFAGMAGGTMVRKDPQMAMYLMLFTGVAGFVFVTVFWILPGALLLTGALFVRRVYPQQEPRTV